MAAFDSLKALVLLRLWLQARPPPVDLSLLPRGLLLSGPPGVGKTFGVASTVHDLNVLFGPDTVKLWVLRGAEVVIS